MAATKPISLELQGVLVALEKLYQAESKAPGNPYNGNLDRLTLQVRCDGRADLYFETYCGHTLENRHYHRDGETARPDDGKWVEEIPLYLQTED